MDAAPARPCRVVIADEDRDAAESLCRLLHMDGHEVAVVHDGPQTLKAIDAFRPDVVLMDVGLPRMNGFEVARNVRHGARSHVTLVAITGWAQKRDEMEALAAGFDHHFAKPVEPDVISELLRRVVRHPT